VQKYAVDDDVPPSIPVDEELLTEATERSLGPSDPAISNGGNKEEVVGHFGKTEVEASSQHKEGKSLSSRWTTGAGPRIGCVREYPTRLQLQALEQLNLSPRLTPSNCAVKLPIPSPRSTSIIHLSPRLVHIGVLSPRVHQLS